MLPHQAFLKMVSHFVALTDQEIVLIDQEIVVSTRLASNVGCSFCLSLPSSAGIRGMCHHTWLGAAFFIGQEDLSVKLTKRWCISMIWITLFIWGFIWGSLYGGFSDVPWSQIHKEHIQKHYANKK